MAVGDDRGRILVWSDVVHSESPARSTHHWHTLQVRDVIFTREGTKRTARILDSSGGGHLTGMLPGRIVNFRHAGKLGNAFAPSIIFPVLSPLKLGLFGI